MASERTAVRVRTGLIIHSEVLGRMGVAIDEALVTDIDGIEFLALDCRHSQIIKLFGIDRNSCGENSNLWVTYLHKLREAELTTEMNKAFKAMDDDCNEKWTRRTVSKKDMFSKLPSTAEIRIPDDTNGEFVMRVALEQHHNATFKFEATEENLSFCINAFYRKPPMEMPPKKKIKPDVIVPYEGYPDVKVAFIRGAKTISTMVTKDKGKTRRSKVIPSTMAFEAEMHFVAKLQTEHDESRNANGNAETETAVTEPPEECDEGDDEEINDDAHIPRAAPASSGSKAHLMKMLGASANKYSVG
jgi:hypothetical protein